MEEGQDGGFLHAESFGKGHPDGDSSFSPNFSLGERRFGGPTRPISPTFSPNFSLGEPCEKSRDGGLSVRTGDEARRQAGKLVGMGDYSSFSPNRFDCSKSWEALASPSLIINFISLRELALARASS